MMNNLKSHNTVTGNIVYIGPKTARGQIEVREVFYSSLVMLVDIGTVIGSINIPPTPLSVRYYSMVHIRNTWKGL